MKDKRHRQAKPEYQIGGCNAFSCFSPTIAFAVLVCSANMVRAELPGEPGQPPVPVIDMHTHVFNSRDLPLAGAIHAMARGWVTKGIADDLAQAVRNLTLPDDLDGPFPPPAKPDSAGDAGFAIVNAQPMASKAAAVPPRTLSESQRARVRGYAGLKPQKGYRLLEDRSQSAEDRRLVADALRNAGFPPPEAEMEDGGLKVQSVGLDGYVRFVDIMTDGNLRIAHRLMTEQYPKVDLFVHHMMDMEMAYSEKPQFQFDEQMLRIGRLDRRLPGEFAGRLIHFVAFDPFRREKALESAMRGLNAGAIGIKFYPPSGYRATSNDYPKRPRGWGTGARKERWDSRYKDLSNAQLDAFNDELFRYCVSNDIPVFTHCTPVGFEADRDYGWMADPFFWGRVLSNYPSLRLCFGHSGGEAYWFADPVRAVKEKENRQRAFGTNVVELCLRYTNVYCEVGYLDSALEKKPLALFTNRLASVLNQPSAGGHWRFGDKVMYGTDWHMMHKVDDHEKYLAVFDRMFAQSPFSAFRRKFFSGNATRFLNLSKVAEDPRFTEEQKRAWRKVIANTVDVKEK